MYVLLWFIFIYFFFGGKVILIMMGAQFKDSINVLNVLSFDMFLFSGGSNWGK